MRRTCGILKVPLSGLFQRASRARSASFLLLSISSKEVAAAECSSAASLQSAVGFIAPSFLSSQIILQIDEVIGDVDERRFLALKVRLQSLDLGLEFFQLGFVFAQKTLLEKRQLDEAFFGFVEFFDLPGESFELVVELR